MDCVFWVGRGLKVDLTIYPEMSAVPVSPNLNDALFFIFPSTSKFEMNTTAET